MTTHDQTSQPSDLPDAAERDAIAFVMNVIDTQFAAAHEGGRVVVERLTLDRIRIRMFADASQIRPGGTISGPTMFKLADLAVWAGVLCAHRDGGVQSVTTNLSINFLRRPAPGDLIAEGRMLKMGRRLAVGEVILLSAADGTVVAQASATYAMPSNPS